MLTFLDVLLCREDGEPRCLMGGDGALRVNVPNLALLGEDGIRAIVAQQGGYVALCLDGSITMFQAVEFVDEQGTWAVDIVRLDPAGLIDRSLDAYNGGRTCWNGRSDATPAAPASRAVQVDFEISDDALESYNNGRKIFRGLTVPAAQE
jgi:hypothetical protein